MNGISYLLDTNVLIYILQGNPVVKHFAQLDAFAVSIVTEMELLGKYKIDSTEKQIVSDVLKNSYRYEIDQSIKAESDSDETTIPLEIARCYYCSNSYSKRTSIS